MRRFLVVLICVGVLLFNFITPVSAYYTNMNASIVIGQTDFTGSAFNGNGVVTPNAQGLRQPQGIYSDGKILIVPDSSGNNRVLIWNSIPTTNGKNADIVLGQPNFTSRTANQGGSASAQTMSGPTMSFYDGTRLFIADASNNRVLIWNSLPTANDAPADVVVGQPDMATVTPGTSATKFNTPQGVWVDKNTGKLIICDRGNKRVLIYNQVPTANGASADVVVGQTDFDTAATGTTASTFKTFVIGAGVFNGKLLVPDFTNNRIMIWNSIPTSNGASADVVIGQPDMVSGSINQGGSSAGPNTLNTPAGQMAYDGRRLFITDEGNHRVLIFNGIPTINNASADLVLGQTNFTNHSVNQGISVGPNTLNIPAGLVLANNQLIVADALNNRILIFTDATTTPSINLITPPVPTDGAGRYRLLGNVFMNTNNQTYGLQTLQADLNGVGYGQINFPSGRNDGSGNSIYDFTYDFDPTVGLGSINNLTIKFLASTFNADTNYLFYFLPFKFNSFNVSSTKFQSFSFSVNKDQLQRVKDNLDHFEVWYKPNTTTGKWTQYISNIPDTQIDQNGLVIATKTTNLTKFVGSYIFKIQAIDNWGNRQDSNYLYTAGTVFPVRIASFTRNFLPLPSPTVTAMPAIGTAVPTPYITPYVVPTQMPVESQNATQDNTKLYLIIAGALAAGIMILFIAWKRKKKKATVTVIN